MSNYELYNKVLSTLNEDEGTFNAAARNWVESADAANFEDEEANELFSSAKLACAAWRNKAINGRVSKLRMFEYVRKIAEKNLPNPYPETKEEAPVVQEIKPVEEKKEEEKIHVLGVLPEKEVVIKQPEEKIAKEIIKESIEEEPKEEKHFFSKRKNR